MVRIQAQTTERAMSQRTAESFWAAPTPTIAPTIVCVVLTGMPSSDVPKSEIAAAASAHAPWYGRSLVSVIRHGLDDPPSTGQCPQSDGQMTDQHNPEGECHRPRQKCLLLMLPNTGVQQRGDNPHSFLSIIRTMSQTIGRC
jgi:hypothetical protein